MLRVAIDKENAFLYNIFLLLSGMLQIEANINLNLSKVFQEKKIQTNKHDFPWSTLHLETNFALI